MVGGCSGLPNGNFLDATGTLLVEVLGDDAQDRMGRALTAAGVPTRPRRPAGARSAMNDLDADVHDLVRDTAMELGLGPVRIQADHRRIGRVADGAQDAVDPSRDVAVAVGGPDA
jgi:ABC-2 type transport system ATP-binding protein